MIVEVRQENKIWNTFQNIKYGSANNRESSEVLGALTGPFMEERGGRDVDREKKKREISSINIKNQNN